MALIANSNSISLPSFSFHASFGGANELNQINQNSGDLINITHSNALGQAAGQGSNTVINLNAKDAKGSKKSGGAIYSDVIATITMHGENYDRKIKQSLLKGYISQLDQDLNVINQKMNIFQEIVQKCQEIDTMYKLQDFLNSRINRANDESLLADYFEGYQKAFLCLNKISNPKVIDQMLNGASKYLGCISTAFAKEIQGSDQGKSKALTEFIMKATKDITNVQTGLKEKAKVYLDDLLKQRNDQGIKKQSTKRSK